LELCTRGALPKVPRRENEKQTAHQWAA
jgi:hypothetical protein